LSDNSPGSILVVDDERGLRDLLSFELGLQGYKVVTAADGVIALDKFRLESFDVVISDIKMPNMGGVELLGKIKEINPNVVFIVMSGTKEGGTAAVQKGAYGFINKPFNIDDAVAIIKKALEKSE